MKSKIIEKIKDVKWNLLDTSIYNIKTEVVAVNDCIRERMSRHSICLNLKNSRQICGRY